MIKLQIKSTNFPTRFSVASALIILHASGVSSDLWINGMGLTIRRITVLRGDEVLSENSDEEEGEELDVDRESEGKVHEEDELCQTEGIEVLAEQVEDFQIHDEGKLQTDDEFFYKMIQQEGMEYVENAKESDIEEYRMEEDKMVRGGQRCRDRQFI
ncbi:hypothetical protein LguiA_030047 [Lonicera macranthoides]